MFESRLSIERVSTLLSTTLRSPKPRVEIVVLLNPCDWVVA